MSEGQGEHVELRVDQLELEGLSVGEPARVRGAFVAELERLLLERGLPARRLDPRGDDVLDAGELTPAELGDPDHLGVAVARRIYEELLR